MLTLQIQRTNKNFLTQTWFSLFIDSRASVDSGDLTLTPLLTGGAVPGEGREISLQAFVFTPRTRNCTSLCFQPLSLPARCAFAATLKQWETKSSVQGANELVRKWVGLQEGFCKRAGTWFPAIPINCLDKLQHLYFCSTAPAVSLIIYSIIYVLWNVPLQGLPLRALKNKSIPLASDFPSPI